MPAAGGPAYRPVTAPRTANATAPRATEVSAIVTTKLLGDRVIEANVEDDQIARV